MMSHARIRRLAPAAALVALGALLLAACGGNASAPQDPTPPAGRSLADDAASDPGDASLRDCPPPPEDSIIEWVPFIQLDAIHYLRYPAVGTAPEPPLSVDDLGPLVATVQCRRDRSALGAAALRDGDAAFLDAGTPLYAVPPYDPTFRIAARTGAAILLYEAYQNDAARTGGDLFDVRGRVQAIELLAKDDHTPVARIDDPAEVERLIALLLNAPLDSAAQTERPHYLALRLDDGTRVVRGYDVPRGIFWPSRVVVPGAFRTALAAALNGPREDADASSSPLTLYVSNQSFDDPTVQITITIDGTIVVDQRFDVEGQHNWFTFDLELVSGDHTLTAESSTGAELRVEFSSEAGQPVWAVIDYWYTRDGPRNLTFDISDEPIVFA